MDGLDNLDPDALLERFFREQGTGYGHDVQSVLTAWRSTEPAATLAEHLLGAGIVTRFGLLKLGAVQKGFLEPADLLAHLFLSAPESEGGEQPEEEEAAFEAAGDDQPILGEPAEDGDDQADLPVRAEFEGGEPVSPVVKREDQRVGDQTGRVLQAVRPGSQLGEVQLTEQIDVGGSSVIYAGQHLRLGHEVVVKVFKHPLGESQGRARFATEVRIGSLLTNPCFVRVYESYSAGGLDCIVMERVHGVTLKAYLAGARLEPKPAARLVLGLARILETAHARGIVHRDVKPHNFYVTRENHLKLGDFGLARILGEEQVERHVSSLDEQQDAFGTPNYVAPEQILDMAAADHRSDMYSVGIILFEVLAGSLPFEGATSLLTLRMQIREKPPLERLAGVPKPLLAILERLLAKQPEARFGDYPELIAELRAYIHDQPLAPRKKPGFFSGLKRFFGTGTSGAG